MKLHPVQGRTKVELEGIAEGILSEIFPENLKSPRPLDVLSLIDIHLNKKYGWSLDVQEVLGQGVLGYTDPNSRSVVVSLETYEKATEGDGRARFTIPHEYSHVVLHRDEMKSWMVSYSPETEKLYRLEEHQIKTWENPEWQANYLAGCLLMPRKTVELIKKKYLRKSLCVQKMMELFEVSFQAAEVRYTKLYGYR